MIDFDNTPRVRSASVDLTKSASEFVSYYAIHYGMSYEQAVQTLFEIGVIYAETNELHGVEA